MKSKALKTFLAIGAMLFGIAAVPAAAFVNWALGLFLLMIPVFMIYKAR